MPTTTALQFRHASSGRPAPDALATAQIVASSRALGWDDVTVEMGTLTDWRVDHLTTAGHFVAINLDSKPLRVEHKGRGGFYDIVMPPDSLWISPAGESFTRRNPGLTRWGAIEISVGGMHRLLGRDVPPQYACGVHDAPFAAALRAMLVEVQTGGTSGALYADGLALAAASRLARQFGQMPAETEERVLEARLGDVIDYIHARLADNLTLAELAALVGISRGHFAREFKRLTREAPHAFVLRCRVERARQMIAAGSELVEVAAACGFVDQSHLTRAFKRRLGVTPGVLKNERALGRR